MATLAGDTAIDGVSLLQRNYTYIEPRRPVDGIRAYGLGARSGHVGYALIDGAQPDGSDEVVIGPGARRRGALGDR